MLDGVYIVIAETDGYDNSEEVTGVFSTLERAISEADEQVRKDRDAIIPQADRYRIYHHQLDRWGEGDEVRVFNVRETGA